MISKSERHCDHSPSKISPRRKIEENKRRKEETEFWAKKLQATGALHQYTVDHLYSKYVDAGKWKLSDMYSSNLISTCFRSSIKQPHRSRTPKVRTYSGKFSTESIRAYLKSATTCNSILLCPMTGVTQFPNEPNLIPEIQQNKFAHVSHS
jgi:hypothetical protein